MTTDRIQNLPIAAKARALAIVAAACVAGAAALFGLLQIHLDTSHIELERAIDHYRAVSESRAHFLMSRPLQSDSPAPAHGRPGAEVQLALDRQVEAANADVMRLQARVSGERAMTIWFVLLAALTCIAAAAWLSFVIGRGLSKPIERLRSAAERPAAGSRGVEMPAAGRHDEIDTMARALEVLRTVIPHDVALDASLESQHRWLCETLDHLPVGVTIFDEQQRVVLRNAQMQRLHPHPEPNRLIGLTIEQLVQDIAQHVPRPGEPRTPDQAQAFAHTVAAQYRAQPEGRIEIGFGSELVDVHFKWIGGTRLVLVQSDITPIRDAEQRAKAAERHLRGVVENLPVGVALYDRHGRSIMRNRRMAWLKQKKISDTDELDARLATIDDSIAYSLPFEVLTSDGRWLDATASGDVVRHAYMTEPEGTIRARGPLGGRYTSRFKRLPEGELVVTLSDETDLEAALDAAARLERQLRAAIEALPIGFALFDPDGMLKISNSEVLREFPHVVDYIAPGRHFTEMLGAYWDTSRVPPPGIDAGVAWPASRSNPEARRAYCETVWQKFQSIQQFTVDNVHDQGVFRVKKITLDDGYLVRTSTDITDLKRKEAEIERLGRTEVAQRTALLREILDTSSDAIAVLDGGNRLTFANRVLASKVEGSLGDDQLTGLPAERLLALLGVDRSVAERLVQDASANIETTIVPNVPVYVRKTRTMAGDSLLAMTDLTAMRRDEAERMAQRDRVLQGERSQAVATLAGSIAHDFNNLLAVILGFSSLAIERLRELAAAPAQTDGAKAVLGTTIASLDNVVASANHGRQIVESMNTLIRERAGTKRMIDLRDIAKTSEPLLRILFPSSARFDAMHAVQPCPILANPVQIEQVITNLCINSVHALDGRAGRIVLKTDLVEVNGGRAEGLLNTEAAARRQGTHFELLADGTISLFIGVLTRGRHVRLGIADDGRGMTEAVARKIFTPFFTTKSKGMGTGLGLSSVLDIVDAHRGGIHVRTRLGVGTVFMILLPEATPDDRPDELSASALSADGNASAGSATEGEPRTDVRILIVDDEERLVELAAAILGSAGYEVEGFTDPERALERVAGQPDAFDLIVTDQTMREMTGLDLAKQVRSVRSDLPVLICTGQIDALETGGAIPAGIRSVIKKPYTPGELLAAVRAALAAG